MFGRRKKDKNASAPAVLNDAAVVDDEKALADEIAKGEALEAQRVKTAKEPEYTFEDLWKDLGRCLSDATAYFKGNYKPGQTDVDNLQLFVIYHAITQTYLLGREAENTPIKDIKNKALKGKMAQDVFFDVFGETRMAPIVGPKSKRMVEIVVLPFMECAAKVYNPWYMPLACKLLKKFAKVTIDLDAEKASAAKIAGEYRRIIAEINAKAEAAEKEQEEAAAKNQQNQEHRSPSPIRK